MDGSELSGSEQEVKSDTLKSVAMVANKIVSFFIVF